MDITIDSRKNGNKQVRCLACSRCIRSDNIKRHAKTHNDLLSMTEDEARDELKARHAVKLEREQKRQKIEEIAHKEGLPLPKYIIETSANDDVDLEGDLLKDNELYLERIELGNKIAVILDKGVIREESLTKERKIALDLYRRQRPRFDIVNMNLRPWQEDALKMVETPSERKIIWIMGRRGNEGKTWFQCYMEAYFGFHRVVRVDLRIKHANICQVLKKRSLGSIDIFLFNDARSVSGEEFNLYRILEDIKDGQATTSKYDNDNIRFKTPNTVMIFSNQYPKVQNLSSDRWQIYNANQDGLNDVTLQTVKMMKRQ